MENIEKGSRYMGQLGMFVTLLGGYSMFTVEDDPNSYSIGVPVLRFRDQDWFQRRKRRYIMWKQNLEMAQ